MTGIPITFRDDLIRLGASASWIVPKKLLNYESICYLAGAGEDIDFDIALAESHTNKVFFFDPTPRAKEHYLRLRNIAEKNAAASTRRSAAILKTTFIDTGLWNRSEDIKFYKPRQPDHVSHSILNLQQTQEYFVGRVRRLSELMKDLGHSSLTLLKIDIEGAEYNVIKTIIEDRLQIRILCVEYDEAYQPIDQNYIDRIRVSTHALIEYGYELVAVSARGNYTFVKKIWDT